MLSQFRQEDDLDLVLGAYARDGAVIVEDLVDADLAQQLLADFAEHLAREPWCNRDVPIPVEWFGAATKRLHGLFGRSPKFVDLAGHPWLDRACRRLLGGQCRDHRIAITELIAIGPGERRQPIHRDSDPWESYPRPRSEIMVNVILALTDFTAENGCTMVVPGSHLWPVEREASETEITSAVMRQGSVLLFSGDILHSGGANRSSETRVAAYVGYALAWLRPLETHVLTNGIDVVRGAPARVRALLGFAEVGWEPGLW